MQPFARRSPLQHAIFDMFRGGSGNPPATGTGTPQQSATGAPNPGNMPTGNPDPNNQNADPNARPDPNKPNPAEDRNKSPLAEFAGLWETPPAPKDGEAVQPDWNDHASIVPELKVDPKKLMESAKRIDFSKAMNPERVAAALKGDVAAFGEVINSVLQASFANSAMSTSKIVEAMSRQMAEKLYTGALPHHFRKHQVNQTIDSENPIFQDPAVAPMLEMAKSQFQVKYPRASAKEISDLAKRYVLTFADAVKGGGKPNDPANKGGPNSKGNAAGEMDWMEFANSTPKTP